jgi:hypothetical protein
MRTGIRENDYNKIEFWGVTVIYILSIFLLISNAVNANPEWSSAAQAFQEKNYSFSYMQNYFFPKAIVYTVLYLAYIFLTLYIVPKIRAREGVTQNIVLGVLVFAGLGLVMGIADTWSKSYAMDEFDNLDAFYNDIFKSRMIYAVWMLFLFAIYNVIKHFGLYLLSNEHALQEQYKGLTREVILAFILWMVSFFLMLVAGADQAVITGFSIIIPFGIGLYWYSTHQLIPLAMKQYSRRKFLGYTWKIIQILTVATLPLSLVLMPIFGHADPIAALLLVNAAFQLFVTAPVAWFMFRFRSGQHAELAYLRQALGTSTANLDLLRSQINPHFLFNSLNTLYGTALQEKAERTSEGIQRLGDMMRFMLEENVQDKISLNREIDYMRNYISLQTLRTQSSPEINIQTSIEDRVSSLSITPMLLIPFIENAFKHGISLREPSHIKITLTEENGSIYFDVYNSIHPRNENDPERHNTGIGLNNVKQRLELFYPGKHELIIRQNAKEFFVHLTIQLNPSA